MITLGGLTATPFQTFRNKIPEGTIKFTAKYKSATQFWHLDIEFKDFILRGQRLVASLNMLDHYRNIIPFGLAVKVSDGADPFLVNDLSSGRVELNILDSDELESLDEFYRGLNS